MCCPLISSSSNPFEIYGTNLNKQWLPSHIIEFKQSNIFKNIIIVLVALSYHRVQTEDRYFNPNLRDMLPSHIIEFKPSPFHDSSTELCSVSLFTVYRKNRGCLVLHCLLKNPDFCLHRTLPQEQGIHQLFGFKLLLEFPLYFITSNTF